jgi:DNA-binding NarL/FixJ family response regulator
MPRADVVGGTFKIESRPGEETNVIVEIPPTDVFAEDEPGRPPVSTPLTNMNLITIIIAEDHTIVREGLGILLGLEKDFLVVAVAANGREAVTLALELRPDVVVMDIAMPLLNGLEATRQILRTAPETKILMLSAHSDDAYVKQALAYGAVGFLVKQTASNLLAEAIREVHQGGACFSPEIRRRLDYQEAKARANGDLPPKSGSCELSPREMEVLQLIAEGKANKETAWELGISIKTVEKHRQNLMEKLDIHDTAGLTRFAIETGIIESSVQSTTVET